MLNHSKAKPMGVLKDVLCQVGVTTIIAKFLILDMPIDRDAPILVGRGFLYTCSSILNTKDKITSTFDGVCHRTFRAAKISLNTKESDSDDDKDYGIQRNSFGAPMYGPKPAKYLNCNDLMDRALALQEIINPFRKIYVWKKVVGFLGSFPVPLQHMEWKPNYKGNFYKMEEGDGQWHAEIRLTDPYENSIRTHNDEAGSSSSRPKRARITEYVEEALMGHIGKRAFDINEPIYTELCHEFYATFEFDEVVADDELMTKKAIKFRLCGKAYAMSILDFAKRLGYDKMNKKGVGTQRESLICYGQFVTRIVKRLGMLSDEVLNGLSAQTYCRTLDANILRKLIGSNRRLIPEEIAPSIPRVATPKAPRPATSDLYDKISQLETQIGEIGRMTHMQSYHSDRYARVLEHIASHYGFTLRDPYNPPNYFEQQQQHDDQE
ncbi:hypothetical protein Tco_0255948 [Tanacetum coccineum]